MITHFLHRAIPNAGFAQAAKLAHQLGVARTVDVLAVLSTGDAEVTAWLTRARQAIEERNHVIHTPWFEDFEGRGLYVMPRGSLDKESRQYRSPSDMVKTVQLLDEVVVEAKAILTRKVE